MQDMHTHLSRLRRLAYSLCITLLTLVLLATYTKSSLSVANDACRDHTLFAQQSCRARLRLDRALWQAQLGGIAEAQLQSVYVGEARISQSVTGSYARQSQGYQHLLLQLESIMLTQTQRRARTLLSQLHSEASAWGRAHPYVDRYDRKSYVLDNGYADQGIGALLDAQLVTAHTMQALQRVIAQTQDTLFNLQMLESDAREQRPFNVVHPVDSQFLAHYSLQGGQVLLVSLVGQAMRVYQHGKLERAFLVTTGRPDHPSLPGLWRTLIRFSPTVFVSPFPAHSPDWFPPTLIHYAILYHIGGYFLHDAWWRANYGPGTQFPHADASGNTLFSGSGSHGCINLSERAAAWLYHHTDWNTTIVIY